MRTCTRFFEQQEALGRTLTFDDVLLKFGQRIATLLPDEIPVASRFTRNVPLFIPIASAAMDTVTEAPLAIAIAQAGGISVIHRNLSPEDQARHVARVKYFVNGRVDRPKVIRSTQTVDEVIRWRDENAFHFSSFPVVDVSGRLIGLVTKDDFRLCFDGSILIEKLMKRDVITAIDGTTPEEAHAKMVMHRVTVLPIIDDEHYLKGLYTAADIKDALTGHETNANRDAHGQLRVCAAVGVGEEALLRARLCADQHVDCLVIDSAHAYCTPVIDTLKQLKSSHPNLDVMVGNVSTIAFLEILLAAGADGIKVGQGGGSICTTRVVTGGGTPQISAVHEVVKALENSGIPICSDGGIRFSGDIAKAIGAGANSVMLGNLLAGTDEAPGDIITVKGRPYKTYRGMGSITAMKERRGSRDRYQQTSSSEDDLVPEGVDAIVPYRGPLNKVLTQYVGGLKHAMGYVGAIDITSFHEIADFNFITNAGVRESHVHDVLMTSEPPNYRRTEQ